MAEEKKKGIMESMKEMGKKISDHGKGIVGLAQVGLDEANMLGMLGRSDVSKKEKNDKIDKIEKTTRAYDEEVSFLTMENYKTEMRRLENIDDQTLEWVATKIYEERFAATKSRRQIYEEVRAARTDKFRLEIKGYLKQPAPVKLESKHDPQSTKRTLFMQSEKHSYRWIRF